MLLIPQTGVMLYLYSRVVLLRLTKARTSWSKGFVSFRALAGARALVLAPAVAVFLLRLGNLR